MDTNAFSSYSGDAGLVLGLSAGALIASLIWGSVGMGFLVYARKQRSIPALLGGVGLIAISYFINSAFWMSVAAAAIIAGTWYVARNAD